VNSVLIIDDDPEVREVVREVLEAEQLRVLCASSGREALQILRAETEPCLILLDLLMPIMSGWQFRAVQAQDPVLARLPVVVMTATSSLEDAAIHADGLLRKPVHLEELIAVVRRYCPRPSGQTGGGVIGNELELEDSSPTH
jgi:CheY-like chemotaxis protein